jgi:hypothetical protein
LIVWAKQMALLAMKTSFQSAENGNVNQQGLLFV